MITPKKLVMRARETRRMEITSTPSCLAWTEVCRWPNVSPEAKYHINVCPFCKNLVSPTPEETRKMFRKKRMGLFSRLIGWLFRK